MENGKYAVGVVRGTDKSTSFQDLLDLTEFKETLLKEWEKSKKEKDRFKVAIKPNMMVYTSPIDYEAIVTDKDMVEQLVDYIRSLGFSDILVCEAQNDAGTMLKNHNVEFIADQIGYKPEGKYKIINLSNESVKQVYSYIDKRGREKKWKDKIGKTWKEADFRISFAKCKSHEHDWLTLALKNVYGCFPPAKKVLRYHIKNEVDEVTARSLRNFPVHFAFVDAWIASDGPLGYKIPHRQDLKMLFGGPDAVAVDMEIFKRAGLGKEKSKFLGQAVMQIYDGKFPEYTVKGDQTTLFQDLSEWENIPDSTVEAIDFLEEIYPVWGLFNIKLISEYIDLELFPPINVLWRIMAWLLKKIYRIFRFFKKLFK